MVTAAKLYQHIKKILENNGIESSQFEAMCIIEHIFGRRLADIFRENPVSSQASINYADNIAYRRIEGEPLQYLLGEWEFFGLPFYVGRGVLIPRQDTETLVEAVIEISKTFKQPADVIDLCSGSGCIACALEKNAVWGNVYALEKSERAIGYLNKNIERNKCKAKVVSGDVLNEKSVFGEFDIVVCNPPYLTLEDMRQLQREVSYEPKEALFGGDDGLFFYRRITEIWKKALKKGGYLAYEIGMNLHEDVKKIMEDEGFFDVRFIRDIPGIIRVVVGRKS